MAARTPRTTAATVPNSAARPRALAPSWPIGRSCAVSESPPRRARTSAAVASASAATGRSGRVNTRCPAMIVVSLPSMAAMAARTSVGTVDSRHNATWLSRTIPAQPPARQAAAVCTPSPPWAHTGAASAATSCWISTNVVVSPTRPPASLPLAMTPAAPAAMAARASTRDVTCTSTRRGASPATAAASVTMIRSTAAGSSAAVTGQLSGNRTANRSTWWPSAASAARARAGSWPRSSTPSAPAPMAAATTPGSGRSSGDSTRIEEGGSWRSRTMTNSGRADAISSDRRTSTTSRRQSPGAAT